MRDGRRLESVRASSCAAAVVAAALASSGTVFSQGEAIPLVDVERVSLRASCTQDARRELERGVALLHGLWQEAAYAAFTVAAERDPRCVLAYWGQAMSALPAPADLEPQLDLDRGRAAVEWAQAIPDGTSRERAYIDTVAAFFDPPAVALPVRLMRHSRAMRALAQDHPDDNEAAAFYARALLALQSGSRQDNQRRAAAWLRARFGDRPNHPGAAHYLVLAYDNPADAGKGLAAADHFARLAPPVPRARHTASHIYTRLGLFEEAARADEAAWAARQAIKARAGDSDESREAMRYGYHSLVSLLYARLQLGQVAHATALLYQARAAAGLPL